MTLNRHTAGITVLEVVIVAAIGSVLLTVLLRFLVAGYPLSKSIFAQASANETARVQLERIGRELRETQYADSGAYPLDTVDAQEIIFYADVDDDSSAERVRYTLDGTDLYRGIIQPVGDPPVYDPFQETSKIVARSIQNGSDPVFIYHNGDYPTDTSELTSANLLDIVYIQFSLFVDVDPAAEPDAIPILSQVQLRNLKTNLGEIEE